MTQGIYEQVVDIFSCFLLHILLLSYYEAAQPLGGTDWILSSQGGLWLA